MTLEKEIEKLHVVQKETKPTSKPIVGFALNQYGNIKSNSLKNVSLIIHSDPLLAGTFAYNEFSHEIEALESIKDLHIEKGNMHDDYIAALLSYIELRYDVLFNDKLLRMALTNEAHDNGFNPVIDYLDKCYKNYDGGNYAREFLPMFLGVPQTEVTELQTNLFFVGAVAKAYDPKTKFDFVLDLVGGQGAGKTTLLKKMANGWYTDQFTDFKDKDSYSNMLRAWIVNDDEMTATNNSDFETLKKFVSAEVLEFRRSYGRESERRDKSFVIARTTNEVTYLKDKTGERRFLPNLVDKSKQKLHPVSDLDQKMVDLLWGEFVSKYKNGFSFNLTREQEEMLNKHRENFMYIDSIEEEIDAFLNSFTGTMITSKQIAKELGEYDLIKNRKLAQKIKYVMDNKSDWKYGLYKINDVPRRGYRRL